MGLESQSVPQDLIDVTDLIRTKHRALVLESQSVPQDLIDVTQMMTKNT